MKDPRFWPFVAPGIVAVMVSLHAALDMTPPIALHYGIAFTGASVVAMLVAGSAVLIQVDRRKPSIWFSLTFSVIAGLLSCVAFPLGIVSSSLPLSMVAAICFGGSFYTFLLIQ